jgi:hypothetical protein
MPGSRPATRSARGRFDRRRKIAGYAALFALASVLVGTLIASGTGSRDTATSTTANPSSTQPVTTTSVDPATLSPVAKELYALIQRGRASGYHVVLSVSGSDLPKTIKEASIEVWRLGPAVRHDTRFVEASGTTSRVDIGGPDGTIQCDTPAGAALSCQRTSVRPIGPDDDFLGFLLQAMATSTTEARADTVGGVAARCYRISNAAGTDVCLTSAGVPLRISESTFVEEARAVETTVDPSVFQPPAPVG